MSAQDDSNSVKVLSWNIRGYTGPTKRRQLDPVGRLDPDIVALQEVVGGSLGFWRDELESMDYSVLNSDSELLSVPGPFLPHKKRRMGRRRNLNLIASKYPMKPLPGFSLPDATNGFPEKYLAASVDLGGREIDVHNAHTPPGSTTKMLKVEYWEAMLNGIEKPTDSARILCGDFNSPWSEDDAGFVVGGDRRDPAEEARWKAAELGFLKHPDMHDVYRSHHRPGEPFPVSYRRGRGTTRTDCRYDHIYASKDFDLPSCRCEYLEDVLNRGLSDHAPVLATLVLR